jgi:hypothetical protein
MKTTTYIFANGKTSVTTSDRDPLTREQYAKACYIIRGAAKAEIARRKALHAHALTESARESLG